jgi:hypothetical protein
LALRFVPKPYGTGYADRKGIPRLAGKREAELLQVYLCAGERRAEIRVPAQGQTLNPISRFAGGKSQGSLIDVEKVCLAQCAFVQLHDDQISHGGNLTDGLSRRFLRMCQVLGKDEDGKYEGEKIVTTVAVHGTSRSAALKDG